MFSTVTRMCIMLLDLYHKMQERVMTELGEHPTIEYIKALEKDRQYYKDKVVIETKKLNDLRIAFNALRNRVDK